MIPKGPALYHINLIRELREREQRAEKQRSMTATLGIACFAFLILAFCYAGLKIWNMESVLSQEQLKLDHLNQEYQKYKAARLIVDKSDIELLHELQGRGIFWTKKLAAMAKHLPDNYWLTRFSFSNKELHVSGYGFVTPQQNQLLVLDDYLNQLRTDTTYNTVFTRIHLNSAQRSEEGNSRVAFDFTAYTADWKSP